MEASQREGGRGQVSFFRLTLARPTLFDTVLCQERGSVRKEFCQEAGSARKGFCQEAGSARQDFCKEGNL